VERRETSKQHDAKHVLFGLMMGGADIIPGVSGGTVALILGIYERLVTAISRFDATWLGHVRRHEWGDAFARIDFRFLLALGSGIVLGIASLASAITYFREHHPEPTRAVFFGLILGSCVMVARMIQRFNAASAGLIVLAAAAAYWLVAYVPDRHPPEGYAYLFLCGMVAICAMILPGISGAFILLILGKYGEVTGAIRDLAHGQITVSALATLVVLAAGCAVGLLGFSKVLRWLLARHETPTMAVMCGLMFGSLRKIWPFQRITIREIQGHTFEDSENLWPEAWNSGEWLAVGLVAAAVAAVFLLDWLTHGHEHVPPLDTEPHAPGEIEPESAP